MTARGLIQKDWSRWIASGLTIIAMVVGWMLLAFNDRNSVEARMTKVEASVMQAMSVADERREDEILRRDELNRRLERIEQKLDQLLQRK